MSSSKKRDVERAPPRELKLHANVLCYYESNSTIVVERSSGVRGVRERCKEGNVGRRGAGRLERAREASSGTEEKGVEYGQRGITRRSIPASWH